MACMLYARENGTDTRVGKFKDRKAAEKFWFHYKENMRLVHDRHPQPIYVETGKGREKR